MGTFTASLRAIGDVKSLAATIELDDGRLSIVAGSTEIGSWPLSDIHLEPIPTGYRLAAEGEQILIELRDLDAFNEALNSGRKRRFRKTGKTGRQASAPKTDSVVSATPPVATHTAPSQVDDRAGRAVALPPREPQPAKTSGFTEKGLAFVDGTLAKANKRFGPYLPEWMFTRVMFAVAFIALILMIVLPGLVSTFLLIAGGLIVVFGAVVYSDPMLASRWLPGRTTPPHVLLFGVAILMLGVLLGVIAT